MADDSNLLIRSYCTRCDSYRPREMFSGPGDSWCNPCRTINLRRYTRNNHDRAIFALGGQCEDCGLSYDPDDRRKTQLNMTRLPGYEFWLGDYADSQYQRDKRIVSEPEIAKKYIKLLCKSCTPRFKPRTTPES